jgi:hypothetical protein
MLKDPLGLYPRRPWGKNPLFPDKGSWQGHLDRLLKEQQDLGNMIDQYNKKCKGGPPIPQYIQDDAKEPLPDMPEEYQLSMREKIRRFTDLFENVRFPIIFPRIPVPIPRR